MLCSHETTGLETQNIPNKWVVHVRTPKPKKQVSLCFSIYSALIPLLLTHPSSLIQYPAPLLVCIWIKLFHQFSVLLKVQVDKITTEGDIFSLAQALIKQKPWTAKGNKHSHNRVKV